MNDFMTQTSQRFVLTLTAVLLVLSCVHSPAMAQRGPASVFAQDVTERDFSIRIEALGTLEPNEVVDLTLNVADRVQSIYFDDGQRVRKGKTLLSLAQREQIALTEGAEATVDEARQQLERLERLIERKAVSQSEVDAAKRVLDSASSQLRAVQSRQKDRVLVAPFDGVLGFRAVSVGSFVSPGDRVARLIDDSEMNLEFSVPSTFLRSLKPGTKITARTDDLPGERFSGEIATLDNRIDPMTRSVKVRATLPNPDRVLMAGMFMEILLTADPRTALAVPEEAIQPLGPKSFVFTVDMSGDAPTARRTEIKVGTLDSGFVEVLSGLSRGDKVITEGIISIREGAQIKIEDKSLLQSSANKTAQTSKTGKTASGSGASNGVNSNLTTKD